jgi:hypothetical protein
MPHASALLRGIIARHAFILFYPDYTVGPGVTPDLLTSNNHNGLQERSRAIPPVGNCAPP